MEKYSKQVQWHERVMETETIQKNGASPKSRKSRGNFKLVTLLAFFILFSFRAVAQDVIVLKSGDEIKSLVQEVGTEYVKYKKFDNQTGPVYNVAISEIFMIKYANGSKDVFNEPAKPQETKTEQAVQQPIKEEVKQKSQKQQQMPVNLSFESGKVYSGGNVLTNEQVRNILMSNDSEMNTNANYYYTSGCSQLGIAKSWGHAGWTFLGIGTASFIVSILTYDGDTPTDTSSLFNVIGWSSYGVSFTSFIISLINKSSGNNRIADAINIYNSSLKSKHSSDLSLNFGVTHSGGIGFTLDF